MKFNLPFAKGDSLWIQGTYADGATQYLGFNPFVQFGAGSFAQYRGGLPGRGGSVGIAYALDGVADARGISTVEGYAITAGAEHFWTPALRTSVFGHYTKLEYNGGAAAKFCAGAILNGGAAIPVNGCNPDFSTYQVGSRTIWSPVNNLDIGVEVLYQRLDQNMNAWNLAASGSRPAGIYTARDTDTFSGTLRFQRNFYP